MIRVSGVAKMVLGPDSTSSTSDGTERPKLLDNPGNTRNRCKAIKLGNVTKESKGCEVQESDDKRGLLENSLVPHPSVANSRHEVLHEMKSFESINGQSCEPARMALDAALTHIRDLESRLEENLKKMNEMKKQRDSARGRIGIAGGKLEKQKSICSAQALMMEDLELTFENGRERSEKSNRVVATVGNLVLLSVRALVQMANSCSWKSERDHTLRRCDGLFPEVEGHKQTIEELKTQLSELQSKVYVSEDQLASANACITSLIEAIQKQQIDFTENEVKMKDMMSEREQSFKVLENKMEFLKGEHKNEMEKRDAQLRSLQAENATLKASLKRQRNEAEQRERHNEDLKKSFGSQVDKTSGKLDLAAPQVKDLLQQLSNVHDDFVQTQREFVEEKEKYDIEISNHRRELSNFAELNRELYVVRGEDRNNLNYCHYELQRLRQDCKWWDWYCKGQSQQISELRAQVVALCCTTKSSVSSSYVEDLTERPRNENGDAAACHQDGTTKVEETKPAAQDEIVTPASSDPPSISCEDSAPSIGGQLVKEVKPTKRRRVRFAISEQQSESKMKKENQATRDGQGRYQTYRGGFGSHLQAKFSGKNTNSSVLTSPSCNSNEALSGLPDSYPVTYEETSFDLASFSRKTMRSVTCRIKSTCSAAGMSRFLTFIAQKIEEMNKDPQWKGRHNLGKPFYWLELRRCL